MKNREKTSENIIFDKISNIKKRQTSASDKISQITDSDVSKIGNAKQAKRQASLDSCGKDIESDDQDKAEKTLMVHAHQRDNVRPSQEAVKSSSLPKSNSNDQNSNKTLIGVFVCLFLLGVISALLVNSRNRYKADLSEIKSSVYKIQEDMAKKSVKDTITAFKGVNFPHIAGKGKTRPGKSKSNGGTKPTWKNKVKKMIKGIKQLTDSFKRSMKG